MATRIKQAVAYVYLEGRNAYPIRISRAYLESLAYYWRKRSDFKYLKIWDIVNYKKGGQHTLTPFQTGYITRNGMKYDTNGLEETQASKDFRAKFRT